MRRVLAYAVRVPRTLNQRVPGSSPGAPTKQIKHLAAEVVQRDGLILQVILQFCSRFELQHTQIYPARHLAGSRRRAQSPLQGPCRSRNITLLYLPPYSPELNKENLWDEIREKIFKNYALKSMDAVRAKLKQAILYIERNPGLVRSITSFPYIINSL